MKNLEIRTIEHKGINVTIKIDYNKGEVSLVKLNHNGGYEKKEYVFANQDLPHMNYWLDVLEAMTIAVKECKKELESSIASCPSAWKPVCDCGYEEGHGLTCPLYKEESLDECLKTNRRNRRKWYN